MYDDVYSHVRNIVLAKGGHQAFLLEWKFIKTRVRYFELIPNWEIERVRDEAGDMFPQIVELRNAMVNEHGVPATGLYSEDTLAEMTQKKDDLVAFLHAWINGDDSVYDSGDERKRKTLKKLTAHGYKEATAIYQWHWAMAW